MRAFWHVKTLLETRILHQDAVIWVPSSLGAPGHMQDMNHGAGLYNRITDFCKSCTDIPLNVQCLLCSRLALLKY